MPLQLYVRTYVWVIIHPNLSILRMMIDLNVCIWIRSVVGQVKVQLSCSKFRFRFRPKAKRFISIVSLLFGALHILWRGGGEGWGAAGVGEQIFRLASSRGTYGVFHSRRSKFIISKRRSDYIDRTAVLCSLN